MVEVYDPGEEDPESVESMTEMATVLDAYIARTDFVEVVRSDPGAALLSDHSIHSEAEG